jgi:hypothetical protein
VTSSPLPSPPLHGLKNLYDGKIRRNYKEKNSRKFSLYATGSKEEGKKIRKYTLCGWICPDDFVQIQHLVFSREVIPWYHLIFCGFSK